MITTDLTESQLRFLLYSVCHESYEKVVHLSRKIDNLCMTKDLLTCEQVFDLAELYCPDELKDYGWRNPKRYLDDGMFYIYTGNEEEEPKWHIEFPMPEKL